MKYYIIGDEDAVLGFGMVGVQGSVARNREEAEEAFGEVLKNREMGIIIITERVAELIRDKVDRYVFTERFPLIVEIPDRLGPVEGRPGLRKLVNRAIGIKI
ncbi:MAG: Vacuolar H+transporting two-sector ATPase F subunit [Spirochaetes bacterium]|nr:MAG: Vacuolar H+transporting two-sector ATPase F subunit [Spirochaetota bacterium]